MSSSSLPGERTLRHTMNEFVPQQLCYFVGHACGIPPLGAAPDLEYFANIVERYATIRWRITKLLFPQFFDSCSDPNAHLCSSEECDPYTSVYETSPLCLLGQYSSVGKTQTVSFPSSGFCSGTLFKSLKRPKIYDWRSDRAFARQFLEGVHPLVSSPAFAFCVSCAMRDIFHNEFKPFVFV